MKRKLLFTALILTLGACAFSGIWLLTHWGWGLTLAITCGTFAYHFDMRLAVGWTVGLCMKNRADLNGRWYRVGSWELRLYERLRVKRWKKYLPTFAPETFDPRLHSWLEIAQAMCQAEIVHEIIVVLSFLPCTMIPRFGAAAVFGITSTLSALLDLTFVILQRHNRPRILRLLSRKGSSSER